MLVFLGIATRDETQTQKETMKYPFKSVSFKYNILEIERVGGESKGFFRGNAKEIKRIF